MVSVIYSFKHVHAASNMTVLNILAQQWNCTLEMNQKLTSQNNRKMLTNCLMAHDLRLDNQSGKFKFLKLLPANGMADVVYVPIAPDLPYALLEQTASFEHVAAPLSSIYIV
jgi:hypothetical protein